MASKHTLTAYCPFAGDEIDVEITYNYTPGRPARGPSYASGGEPADPPENEFVSATITGATLPTAIQEKLNDWASLWITGDGWDDAVSHAADE
jgi:hypothetical protein